MIFLLRSRSTIETIWAGLTCITLMKLPLISLVWKRDMCKHRYFTFCGILNDIFLWMHRFWLSGWKKRKGKQLNECSRCFCQMFAVYVLCGAQGKDAVRLTLEQIDLVKRMCNKAQDLELVKSYDGTRGHSFFIIKQQVPFFSFNLFMSLWLVMNCSKWVSEKLWNC